MRTPSLSGSSRFLLPVAAVLLTAAVSFGMNALAATFTEPASAPPADNAYAPLDTSANANIKLGALVVNNGTSPAATGFIVSSGNVGIGTTTPAKKLDVVGDIRGTRVCLGTTCVSSWPPACTGDNYLQFDGTQWLCNAPGTSSGPTVTTLVNGAHTSTDCTGIGGSVAAAGTAPDNSTAYVCRVTQSSCPAGWTQYQSWSTGNAKTCNGGGGSAGGVSCLGSSCTVNGWNWSNQPNQSCSYNKATLSKTSAIPTYSCNVQKNVTCQATVIEVGCY